MEKQSSTLKRVTALLGSIDSDITNLNSFLKLFKNYSGEEIKEGSLLEFNYGTNKKFLDGSIDMLVSSMQNITKYKHLPNFNAKLDSPSKPKEGWYLFEGYSTPDIYIETSDSIFIGEIKQTEQEAPKHGEWFPIQDQLIRHIDSLLDLSKNIYSFYILGREEYGEEDLAERLKLYSDIEYFKNNLKHRDDPIIERAANSFIGYLFWEDIADLFDTTKK